MSNHKRHANKSPGAATGRKFESAEPRQEERAYREMLGHLSERGLKSNGTAKRRAS